MIFRSLVEFHKSVLMAYQDKAAQDKGLNLNLVLSLLLNLEGKETQICSASLPRFADKYSCFLSR